MKKLLLLFLISLPLKATTFTITLLTPAEAAVTKDAFVRFELHNYGNQLPHVTGANVILPSMSDFYPNASGIVSGTIQGNDTITPTTTYYHICFYKDGVKFYCCDMVITGSSVVIDGNSCLVNGAGPVIPPPVCPPPPTSCGGNTAMLRRQNFWWAGCNGTTASNSWELGTMVPACAGVNTIKGVLNSVDGQIAYWTEQLGPDWTSFGSAYINFTTPDTTQNDTIQFQLKTVCVAPGTNVTDDPTYPAAQNFSLVTIPAGAVANASYNAMITTVTAPTCGPKYTVHFQIIRGTDSNATASLVGNFEVDYNGTLL